MMEGRERGAERAREWACLYHPGRYIFTATCIVHAQAGLSAQRAAYACIPMKSINDVAETFFKFMFKKFLL
jgi:hypothetical protein